MRFHIHTYGCQMNVRDSEAAAALLITRGYEPVSDEAQADLILVNTCSVRGKAEDKALGKLRLLVVGKQDAPGRIVGIMGCMAQRLQDELLRSVRGLDFVIGTRQLSRLPEVLDEVCAGRGPVVCAGGEDEDVARLSGHLSGGGPSAFVNILFGCDRRCSYCIVPDVRGHERSRLAADVLAEVEGLAVQGVREVTLLGQSVMSYGRRQEVWAGGRVSAMGLKEPLPRLLEAVCGISGVERVRFMSGHPSGCTAALARVMAEQPKVCPYLHLPVQSGSDRILARMRRGYTADDYRRAVTILRDAVPGLSLTTDIIVGFPGETEEDFEATARFAEMMDFDNAFIFKYSPRPGTPAAAWEDDVPYADKMKRNRRLLDEQDIRGLRLNQRLVGTVQQVLVEGVSLRNSRRWSGRSRNNKIVVFDPPPGVRRGDLIEVRIERVMAQTIYGVAVEK